MNKLLYFLAGVLLTAIVLSYTPQDYTINSGYGVVITDWITQTCYLPYQK